MNIYDKILKCIFILSSFILISFFGLSLGYYSNSPTQKLGPLKEPIKFISTLPEQIEKYSKLITSILTGRPTELLYPDYFPGKSGIIRATDTVQEGYLLISRLSQKENQFIIELMNKKTGEIIHTWIPSYEDIYKKGNKNIFGRFRCYLPRSDAQPVGSKKRSSVLRWLLRNRTDPLRGVTIFRPKSCAKGWLAGHFKLSVFAKLRSFATFAR